MSPEVVLVTGGAGYIGSHTVHALVAQGYGVVVLDDLSTGSRNSVPQGAQFVRGDIADKRLVTALLRTSRIKTIFHFAAFIDVAESEREPAKYYENNYHRTGHLLQAAKAANVENFIFSSTAAVYGNPDQIPVPEHAILNPVSVYGKSKLQAEKLVEKSGMNYANLRYFNVAGTHHRKGLGYQVKEGKEPTHLIRRVVLAMLGDVDHIDVFGTDYPTVDGTSVRDYIHVRDLASAQVDIFAYLMQGGESGAFNVGYRKGYTVLEVISAAEAALGKKITTQYQERREGDPMMIIADNQKLMSAIKWQPQFPSLCGMILDEYDWVKSQKALAK